MSDPDLNAAREHFNHIDFLAVQDIFMTETAEIADVVLPAASWAEKDGTFTNTDRRVQRVRPILEPARRSAAGLGDRAWTSRDGWATTRL